MGLPHVSFTEAPQNVPRGTDPAPIMGSYFPTAAYCSQTTFESGGADACLGS
jgi:hypothetical protein